MIDTEARQQGRTQNNPEERVPSPYWVAHRGGSNSAPENSLTAFRTGLASPARYIEGDFRLTADQHIIACHDATLLQASGTELEVASHSLEALQRSPLSTTGKSVKSVESVPTLNQVLALLPADKGLFLEIKTGAEMVPWLVRALSAYELACWQVVVIAFDPAVVRAVRQQLPMFKVHWLFEWHEDLLAPAATIDELIATAIALNAQGLGLNYCEHLTPTAAAKVHAAGLELHIYTVNELQGALRCIELGVDSITTDHPEKLVTAVAQGDW